MATSLLDLAEPYDPEKERKEREERMSSLLALAEPVETQAPVQAAGLEQDPSFIGAAGRAAVTEALPALGGVASAIAGAKLGAATLGTVGTFITPGPGTAIGATVGAIGGAILGGFGGSEVVRQVQDFIASKVAPEEWEKIQQQKAIDAEKQRGAVLAGEIGAQLVALRPSATTLKSAASLARQIVAQPKNVATLIAQNPSAAAALADVGVSGVAGGAIQTGREWEELTSEDGDALAAAGRILAATAANAAMTEPTGLSKKLIPSTVGADFLKKQTPNQVAGELNQAVIDETDLQGRQMRANELLARSQPIAQGEPTATAYSPTEVSLAQTPIDALFQQTRREQIQGALDFAAANQRKEQVAQAQDTLRAFVEEDIARKRAAEVGAELAAREATFSQGLADIPQPTQELSPIDLAITEGNRRQAMEEFATQGLRDIPAPEEVEAARGGVEQFISSQPVREMQSRFQAVSDETGIPVPELATTLRRLGLDKTPQDQIRGLEDIMQSVKGGPEARMAPEMEQAPVTSTEFREQLRRDVMERALTEEAPRPTDVFPQPEVPVTPSKPKRGKRATAQVAEQVPAQVPQEPPVGTVVEPVAPATTTVAETPIKPQGKWVSEATTPEAIDAEFQKAEIDARNRVREWITSGMTKGTQIPRGGTQDGYFLITKASPEDVVNGKRAAFRITSFDANNSPIGHTAVTRDAFTMFMRGDKSVEDSHIGDLFDLARKSVRPDLYQGRSGILLGEPTEFSYRLKYRDAGIGTAPKGFIRAEGRDVVYDRPLTSREIYDFEMEPVGARTLSAETPTTEVTPQVTPQVEGGYTPQAVFGHPESPKTGEKYSDLIPPRINSLTEAEDAYRNAIETFRGINDEIKRFERFVAASRGSANVKRAQQVKGMLDELYTDRARLRNETVPELRRAVETLGGDVNKLGVMPDLTRGGATGTTLEPAIGAAIGYGTTEQQEGESDEDFRNRQIRNALIGAGAGYAVGRGASAALSSLAIRDVGSTALRGIGGDVPPRVRDDVKTPAFKRWFGDWEKSPETASKAVDDTGRPQVVYHATSSDFDTFDLSRSSGVAGAGAYFTSKPPSSDTYGDRVMPVYVSIKNPIDLRGGDGVIFDAQESFLGESMRRASSMSQIKDISKRFSDALKNSGYDGVIMDGEVAGESYYVAFDPTQIKSAIANQGTYDPTDPNILRATPTPIPEIRPSTRVTEIGEERERGLSEGFRARVDPDMGPISTYNVSKDVENRAAASLRLANQRDAVIARLADSGNTADLNAQVWDAAALIKESYDKGDVDTAVRYVRMISQKQTDAARAIRATQAIYGDLPRSFFTDMAKAATGRKLTAEEQAAYDLYRNIIVGKVSSGNEKTDAEMRVWASHALTLLTRSVTHDPTIGDYLAFFVRASMLLNPSTLIKARLGNMVGYAPTVASDNLVVPIGRKIFTTPWDSIMKAIDPNYRSGYGIQGGSLNPATWGKQAKDLVQGYRMPTQIRKQIQETLVKSGISEVEAKKYAQEMHRARARLASATMLDAKSADEITGYLFSPTSSNAVMRGFQKFGRTVENLMTDGLAKPDLNMRSAEYNRYRLQRLEQWRKYMETPETGPLDTYEKLRSAFVAKAGTEGFMDKSVDDMANVWESSIMPSIHEDAMNRAALATFNDPNFISTASASLVKALNFISTLGLSRKIGVGTAILPFTQIPGSVFMRMVDTSPFGFMRALYKGYLAPMNDVMGKVVSAAAQSRVARGKEVESMNVIQALSELRRDDPAALAKLFDTTLKEHLPEATRILGNATLGTAGGVALGAILYNAGVITASPPDEAAVRDMERTMQKGPFQLNVSALRRLLMGPAAGEGWFQRQEPRMNDVMVSYDWLQPFSFPVAMGAEIARSDEREESFTVRGKRSALETAMGDVKVPVLSDLLESAAPASKVLFEQQFLTGVQRLAEDISYYGLGVAFGKQYANLASMAVPQVAVQMGNIATNQVPETRAGNILDASLNQLQSRLSFAGEVMGLPPKYDAFGEKVKRYREAVEVNPDMNPTMGMLFDGLNQFVNPFRMSFFKDNPAAKEMLRLHTYFGAEALPNNVPAKLKVNGEETSLSTEQIAILRRFNGRITATFLGALFENPDYRARWDRMDEATKSSELGKLFASIGTAGKVLYLGESPASVDKVTRGIIRGTLQGKFGDDLTGDVMLANSLPVTDRANTLYRGLATTPRSQWGEYLKDAARTGMIDADVQGELRKLIQERGTPTPLGVIRGLGNQAGE